MRYSGKSSSPRPTIRDVSRVSGVSTATVSRVLAGLGGAAGDTIERIERAARELGYTPNRMARSLRATKSRLIGVVIPDLQNPFFTGVVGGIEAELIEAGFTLFLSNSDESVSRESRELKTLVAERAAGVLLIPCSSSAARYREWVGPTAPPLATIDRCFEGLKVDSVVSSNEQGAFEAVSRLLSAGYGSVGYVGGPNAFSVARERMEGYLRALAAFGVEPSAEWMTEGDFRVESGYLGAKAILGAARPPRALFVASFLMALGALRAIHERGLSIPDELALITFDDPPWAESMNPPLSAVAQPVRELGRRAARLLLERLEDPSLPPRSLVLDTSLKLRDSCGTRDMP